jgi:hypothetical protein
MFESVLPAAAEDPVFAMHRGGKISVRPSVDVTDRQGLAMAYTPRCAPRARPESAARVGASALTSAQRPRVGGAYRVL